VAKVTVYQFAMYDIESDNWRKSRRWGTKAAIENIGGAGFLKDTAVDVDESVLGADIEGLSDIGYDPHAMKGFQGQMRS
jgi:hypothetical protein